MATDLMASYANLLRYYRQLQTLMAADLKAREAGEKPAHTVEEMKIFTAAFPQLAASFSQIFTSMAALAPPTTG